MDILSSSSKDLSEIARCHRQAFPYSLSSKLGLGYCMNMLSFYLEDKRGLLFHFEDQGRVVGYCGGLMHSEFGKHGSATSMTQHTFSALIKNVIRRPWLILHPDIINRLPFIWKNVKLRMGISKSSLNAIHHEKSAHFIPSIGLIVIGVLPEYQGKGYGSVLLKEFERRARETGFNRIHLSVKKDNVQAISAYMKNGWITGSTGKEEVSMYKILE